MINFFGSINDNDNVNDSASDSDSDSDNDNDTNNNMALMNHTMFQSSVFNEENTARNVQ